MVSPPADHPRSVGIFGGTFDPPHRGHTTVVADVADALALDEVLWIPAGEPPHKSERRLSPAAVRLRMVRAAIAEDPRFRVSDVEIRRAGPSYTVDTLRALTGADGQGEGSEAVASEGGAGALLADDRLYLIVGIDQFRDFTSWHRPEEIRELVTLAIMDRGGEGLDEERAERADDLVRVPVRRVDVSSTMVRQKVRAGESVAGLVHPEVARIIDVEGLYRDGGS